MAKSVVGLDFQPSTLPRPNCTAQPFFVSQERDEFYKGLKEVKSKPAVPYRRGHDVVVSYPDSTKVRLELWKEFPETNPCLVLPKFDPAKLQFRVEWQNGQQIVPGKGKFAVSEPSSPQPWCEDKCRAVWAYELTVDSEKVPLQSQLILTIETEDGTQLAKYLGKLSTARRSEPQHLPSIQ